MKRKFIKLGLGRKIEDWLESITDTRVRELASKNVIVTGGCIVSMLLGEEPNDFDVYFRDKETTQAVAEYYVALFLKNPPQSFKDGKAVAISVKATADRVKIVVKSSGIAGEEPAGEDYQYFEQIPGTEEQESFIESTFEAAKETVKADTEKPKYRPMFLTTNAITLSHKIQIVLRFFGTPEQIHSTYDFVHCTCYYDHNIRELVLPSAALESILAKDLFYMGQSKYPICAMVRLRKFLKRGWHINAGQMLKIAWDISRLDLTRVDVLEDQLVGVDTAYFHQLITALRQQDKSTVDAGYLCSVIDKLF